MTRRLVALWTVLGCFGVGAALDSADFLLEECCEDLRLTGHLRALLLVVRPLSAGAVLMLSTVLYRDSNAWRRYDE